jgi:rhodanese-related sulfurtransferase
VGASVHRSCEARRDAAGTQRVIILVFVRERDAGLPELIRFLSHDWNWALALVFVLSGAMLLVPLAQRRLGPVREIGTLDATRLLNKENPLVLDVREAAELEGGRLPNAVHIPLSQLKDRGGEIAKHAARPVIVYCARGARSSAAIGALSRLGFKQVQSLRGGFRAWKDAGLPVAK